MPRLGDIRYDGMVFLSKNAGFESGEYWVTMDKFLKNKGSDWFERRARMDANVKARAAHEAGIPSRKAEWEAGRDERMMANKERIKAKARESFARQMEEAPELLRAKRRAYYGVKKDCPEFKETMRAKYERMKERNRLKNAPIKEAKRIERERIQAEKEAAREAAKAERLAIVAGKKAARELAEALKPRRVPLTDEERLQRKRDEKRNYKHRRRARLRSQEVKATPSEIRAAMKKAKGKCHYCKAKVKALTIDHVVPIAKGGTHTLCNIVFACHACNSEKRDILPHVFAAQFGMLIV